MAIDVGFLSSEIQENTKATRGLQRGSSPVATTSSSKRNFGTELAGYGAYIFLPKKKRVIKDSD